MTEGRKTDRYRDVIQVIDEDHRESLSMVLGSDGQWRHTHQQERDHENVLPAELVAVMTEHDAAERPRYEAYGVGG